MLKTILYPNSKGKSVLNKKFFLFFLIICCFILQDSTVPVFANEKSYRHLEYEDYFEPVPLSELVKAKAENTAGEEALQMMDTKETGFTSYLLEGVIANTWIITRAVVNGIADIKEAAEFAASEEAVILNSMSDALAFIRLRCERSEDKPDYCEKLGEIEIKRRQGDIVSIKMPPDLEAEARRIFFEHLENSKKSVFHRKYALQLMELVNTGFFGDSEAMSMMDRTRFISLILLFTVFMGKIAYMAWTSLTQKPVEPLKWWRETFKLIFLIFFLAFMGKFVMFGISYSDNIRDVIISSAFTKETGTALLDPGQIASQIIKVRSANISLKPSLSLIDYFSSPVSEIAATGLGYISYFIASAVIFIISLMGDILMSLAVVIGPIVVALTMLPTMEDSTMNWFKGYLTILFYGPLTAVYSLFLIAMMSVGIDSSAFAFIVINIAYIMGACKIPTMAKEMQGAVMAGVAIGIASIPMKFATGALGQGAKAAVGRVTG